MQKRKFTSWQSILALFSRTSKASSLIWIQTARLHLVWIQERIEETVSALQIQNLLKRNIFALSGGEKQTLAFASVYAMSPAIYVLDEPTANLDEQAIERLRQQIMLLKSLRATVVVAEHRLYFLADIIDRAIYIHEGKDIPLYHHEIEFRNVDFGYDQRTVLHNVSFRIPEKTMTAIVGPSGSGKSTICSLIARFYDIQNGCILVGGHDVREMTCDSLLQNISMVFQNVYLFNDTIRNNIHFGNSEATEDEIIAAAKAARCHDFITALTNGYDTIVGEGGGTLSGGEKQRISIARAILKNAPIIILDEATASIDPENEHLIQQALPELTVGKTVITIAHRLATIEHADQILVVDNGQIVQKGTHRELITQKGLYQRFMQIREQAEEWSIM